MKENVKKKGYVEFGQELALLFLYEENVIFGRNNRFISRVSYNMIFWKEVDRTHAP